MKKVIKPKMENSAIFQKNNEFPTVFIQFES